MSHESFEYIYRHILFNKNNLSSSTYTKKNTTLFNKLVFHMKFAISNIEKIVITDYLNLLLPTISLFTFNYFFIVKTKIIILIKISYFHEVNNSTFFHKKN